MGLRRAHESATNKHRCLASRCRSLPVEPKVGRQGVAACEGWSAIDGLDQTAVKEALGRHA